MASKKKYTFRHPLSRLYEVLEIEKDDITAIYIYAILAGILSLTVPLGIQSIINFAITGVISISLIVLIILVVTGVFLTGLLQINQLKLIEKIQQRIFVRYAYEFTYKIPKFNTLMLDDTYLPELVNRFFDTATLQKSLSKLLIEIPSAMIQILFSLILLSMYSSVFVFFSLLIVLILYLILYLTGGKGLKTSMEESDWKYEMGAWLEEIARVFRSFKFTKGSSHPLIVTDKIAAGYVKARTSHFKILLFQYWSLIAFKIFITAGMLGAGAYLLINNQINVGQFVAAEIVILTVLNSIEKIIKSIEYVYDLMTSIEKLAKVTEKSSESGGQLLLNPNSEALTISLEQLHFGYEEDNVLAGINATINSGDKVAITGSIGSGKSTLLKLLSFTYPISKGQLLINSLPMSNYNLESLRSQIGMMFSEQEIFKGSLIDNITLGCNTIQSDDIIKIANIIGLTGFISQLKNGLDTELEPTGKGLPSSVIKKILLCRALVGDTKLILLDEPFIVFNDRQEKLKFINYLCTERKNTSIVIATNDEDYIAHSNLLINV